MKQLILRLFIVAFVAVLTAGPVAAQSLPSGWATKDIGSVAAAGSATATPTGFTVTGSGADVWGAADEFRFVYRPLTGDGSIVTRVTAIDHADPWSKAGVMMRETLTANSRHAHMVVSVGKGLAFQRRTATGGASSHTAGSTGTSPAYVKLTRTGSTFTAQQSLDGTTWTTVGSQSIAMATTIYVGVAVTSHRDGVLAAATFEETTVAEAAAPIVEPPPAAASTTLRLLHWNAHHGGQRSDGVYDPAGFADWLAKFNPDVITLNEIDTVAQADRLLAELKAKMPGVPWTYYYLGHMKGNMILSRFPIVAQSTCVVNTTDDRRVAHIGVVVNGRTLNVWDAHLSLDGSGERTSETRALQACETNWPEARIAAGDYNMQADTAEYKSMTEGHVDAWRAAKALGTAVNYSGNCDGCTRNSRIDFVFTSKGASWLVLTSAEIFDTRNASGVMASDHKPMLVVYDVK